MKRSRQIIHPGHRYTETDQQNSRPARRVQLLAEKKLRAKRPRHVGQ